MHVDSQIRMDCLPHQLFGTACDPQGTITPLYFPSTFASLGRMGEHRVRLRCTTGSIPRWGWWSGRSKERIVSGGSAARSAFVARRWENGIYGHGRARGGNKVRSCRIINMNNKHSLFIVFFSNILFTSKFYQIRTSNEQRQRRCVSSFNHLFIA